MTRAQIIELLDCEFSYGHVHGGRAPWVIVHSTLPWREGRSIDIASLIADGTVLVDTFSPDDRRVITAR